MNRKLVLAVSLAIGSSPALSADWSFDPRIYVGGYYNDNHRLSEDPDGEIQVSGGRVDVSVGLRAVSPRSQFELVPRIRSSFFPGDEDEETDDEFVKLTAQHRTERLTARLGLDYSQIDTLGSFFPEATVNEDAELGDPNIGVEVGRTEQRNRQDQLRVSPELEFKLSEKRSLELEAEYLETNYDVQVAGDREDYTNVVASAALRQVMTPTTSFSVRAGYGSFDPSEGQTVDAYGLTAEWWKELSETSRMYVRGGAQRLELVDDGSGSTDWDTGFAGGAGIQWSFQVTDVWLDASRSLSPNSAGTVVTRDELRAQVARQLTPMLRVTAGARIISDSAADDRSSFDDRTYASGVLSLDWRFARAWTLSASYDYTWREYDGSPTNADSNAMSLGVTYRPMSR